LPPQTKRPPSRPDGQKPRAGDRQRAVEVRLTRLTVEDVSRRNMPANGCAAAKEGHRDVLAARCASGLTSSPRVFQPEPQNVGLDGADRHGHAIVGELSVLRLVGHAALEDFPFYEDARRRTTPALPRAPILWRRISGRASKVSAHRFVRRAGYRLSRKRKAPRRQVTGVIFVKGKRGRAGRQA
jgi:hypothetical protein